MHILAWAMTLCLGLGCQTWAQGPRIVFDLSRTTSPRVKLAVEDAAQLLRAGVLLNPSDRMPEKPAVIIRYQFPDSISATLPTVFTPKDSAFPYLHVPAHDFTWTQVDSAGIHVLTAKSPSTKGLADATYALLQEQLGFAFHHPERTLIPPPLDHWPITSPFTWTGRPNFDKQGFHLHTMHPTELTQALHDPRFPGGMRMLRHYVDWLARNGQNYFDFSLMEDVEDDFPHWLAHINKLIAYAHLRGIMVGVDVSVHMLQQKSYQIVHFPPRTFRSYEWQVRQNIRNLTNQGFDVINLEFALAEFVGGFEQLRDRLRTIILEEMALNPGVKLVGRQHVIKPESEIGGKHDESAHAAAKDPAMGLLVHTVMCYALEDASAPVYELQDFSHLLELLKSSHQERETWYYPESAYWITFDNSIPLFLMPYLGARWRDMQTVRKIGIPGHLTFSSGWEWGYWSVDWSIARWGWRHEINGQLQQTHPTQYLGQALGFPESDPHLARLHDFIEVKLVQENLLAHLCPTSPSDEFPDKFNNQFQPRAPWHITDLRERKMADSLKSLPGIIARLETVADSLKLHLARLPLGAGTEDQRLLQRELWIAMHVMVMRMQHRAAIYGALFARGHRTPEGRLEYRRKLAEAAEIRKKALEQVAIMESNVYRYPLQLLAGRYDSFTAYDFGYLHPVHKLHFWEREEMQVKTGRKGPFYRNLFDLAKIGGLKD